MSEERTGLRGATWQRFTSNNLYSKYIPFGVDTGIEGCFWFWVGLGLALGLWVHLGGFEWIELGWIWAYFLDYAMDFG